MTTEMQLITVASLLRRGKSLDQLSSAVTLLALLIGLSPMLGVSIQSPTTVFCVVLIVLGMLQKFWALRVALDAELFQQLAERFDQLENNTRDLDQTLVRLNLHATTQTSRTWDERCLGAMRLFRRQGLCFGAQLLIALLAILGLPWLSFTG